LLSEVPGIVAYHKFFELTDNYYLTIDDTIRECTVINSFNLPSDHSFKDDIFSVLKDYQGFDLSSTQLIGVIGNKAYCCKFTKLTVDSSSPFIQKIASRKSFDYQYIKLNFILDPQNTDMNRPLYGFADGCFLIDEKFALHIDNVFGFHLLNPEKFIFTYKLSGKVFPLIIFKNAYFIKNMKLLQITNNQNNS